MRARLVSIDLDGTLMADTALHAALADGPHADEFGALVAAWREGAITQEGAARRAWPWLQELSLQELSRRLRRAPWLTDIAQGVERLQAAGWDVVVLTDQPAPLAEQAARWGFDAILASATVVKEGRMIRAEPRGKLDLLRQYCAAAGRDMRDVCHVGNATDDVAVFAAVGASVAYAAPADVAAAATWSVPRSSSFLPIVDAVLSLPQRGGK
jgi:phosphoserine phosphatase